MLPPGCPAPGRIDLPIRKDHMGSAQRSGSILEPYETAPSPAERMD
ncbi:MAG: hypothetical protein FD144_433 [Rhodospirillaceae bacterium]|nr:MAG: hypothetical protein FD144_433 [Rhodospirillaceae bacterium]